MKIGELAKSTGLSVRTLHHYDELGLLKPSSRTEAGHRVYTEDDVLRLHKIISLKQLNLPLEQIRGIIGESFSSVQESLDRQLEALEVEIESKQLILRRVRVASEYVQLMETVDLSEIVKIIKDMVVNERYLSKQQLDDLEHRGKELGDDKLRDIINEMPVVIEKVRLEMELGTSPNDSKVRALLKRWRELGEYFIGDDPELVERVKQMHLENPEVRERHGVSPELMEYIKKAKQLAESAQQEGL